MNKFNRFFIINIFKDIYIGIDIDLDINRHLNAQNLTQKTGHIRTFYSKKNTTTPDYARSRGRDGGRRRRGRRGGGHRGIRGRISGESSGWGRKRRVNDLKKKKIDFFGLGIKCEKRRIRQIIKCAKLIKI